MWGVGEGARGGVRVRARGTYGARPFFPTSGDGVLLTNPTLTLPYPYITLP